MSSVTQGVRRNGAGLGSRSSVPSPGLFLLCFVPGRKRDGSGEEGGEDSYCSFAVSYSPSVSQPSRGPRTCPTDLQPPGRPSCCTLVPSWHLCQGHAPSGGSQLVTEPGRPCRDVRPDPFLGDLGPHRLPADLGALRTPWSLGSQSRKRPPTSSPSVLRSVWWLSQHAQLSLTY